MSTRHLARHPAALLLLTVVALAAAPAAHAQARGTLVSVEPLATVNPDQIVGLALEVVPDFPAALMRLLINPRLDVAAYRVVYNTIDGLGQPTIASGMVAVPIGETRKQPMMMYHHGTFADDASAPSNLGREVFIGYAFATHGYVAVLPDYLGFGASPIPVHPYVHAKTEATASVDLARTVQSFLRAGGYPLNGQLFITGYSQGGHACVATMREIQNFHAGEFNLVAATPGSGPYNVAGVQADFITRDPEYSSPGYLPFLLLGYQSIYGNLYSDLSEVFVPPYDTTIPSLFDRVNTMGQIESQLPRQWANMFQADYIDAVLNDRTHPASLALVDQDLLNFKPESPLFMFFCSEDEQVDPRNAVVAWLYYSIIRGADNVLPIPVGAFTHTPECIALNLYISRLIFNSMRI